MAKINYKSDFDFILKLRDCGGKEVGFPDHDWTARFWTSTKANIYVASRKGDVLTNCFNDNGQIHIVCNNHGLGRGELKVEYHAELPNGIYPDGVQDLFDPQPLGIELVDGQGDCPTEIEVEGMLPYIRGERGPAGPQGERGEQGPKGDDGASAYEQAVEGGYKGTKQDFEAALANIDDAKLSALTDAEITSAFTSGLNS